VSCREKYSNEVRQDILDIAKIGKNSAELLKPNIILFPIGGIDGESKKVPDLKASNAWANRVAKEANDRFQSKYFGPVVVVNKKGNPRGATLTITIPSRLIDAYEVKNGQKEVNSMLQNTSKPNESEKELTDNINNSLMEFARQNGIKVEFVQSLINEHPEDPVAYANMVQQVIRINENKADKSTLPEELAHILTLALGEDNIIVQRALNLVKRVGVDTILGPEFDRYRILYKGDEKLLAHEALGKLISQAIVRNFENPLPKTENSNKLWDTILRLIDRFISLFRPNNNIMNELQKDVEALSNIITSGKKINITPNPSRFVPNISMFQTDNHTGRSKYATLDSTKKVYAFVNRISANNKIAVSNLKRLLESTTGEERNKILDRIDRLTRTGEQAKDVIREVDMTNNLQALIDFAEESLGYIDGWITSIENGINKNIDINTVEHIRQTLAVFKSLKATTQLATGLHDRLLPLIKKFATEEVQKVFENPDIKEYDILGGTDIFEGKARLGTLTDVNNYLGATIGHAIKDAQAKATQLNRDSEKKHEEEIKHLHDYYVATGKDPKNMYDIFIQEDNGTLVLTKEYTTEFYDKLREIYKDDTLTGRQKSDKKNKFAKWIVDEEGEGKWVPKEDKYFNQNYKTIMRTPQLKRFYDYHQAITQNIINQLPINGYKNFIPNVIEESLMDIWKSDKGFMKKFGESLGYLTGIQDVSEDGPKYDHDLYPDTLPLKYISKADAKIKSRDLGRSLLKFIHFGNTYAEMSEVLPKAKLLKELIDTNSYTSSTTKKDIISGSKTNLSYMVDSFIKMQILGKMKEQENLPVGEGRIRYDQIIDFGIKYTSMLRIGFNPFSAVTNVGIGRIGNVMEAHGGRYFTYKQYVKAEATFLKQAAFEDSKVNNLIRIFNPLMELEDYEAIEKVGISYLTSKKYQEKVKNSMYWFQKTGEKYLQASTMIAMMMHDKIKALDGTEVSMWEAFDKDGNWNKERFGEMPEKLINKFTNKVHAVNRNIHGRYSQKDAAAWSQKALFRMFFQFRKWLPAAYESRLQQKRFDISLGHEVEGRWLTYYKYAKLLLAKLSNDAEKMQKYGFTETDIYNMRKNMSELVFGLVAVFAAMGLKGLGDDDKELKKSGLYKFSMMQLDRISGDMLVWLDPRQQYSIVASAAPMFKTVQDLLQVIDNIPSLLQLTDHPEYQRGPRKGENRFLAQLKDVTVGIKPITDVYRIFAKEGIPYQAPRKSWQ
jgi:hypothetical protein